MNILSIIAHFFTPTKRNNFRAKLLHHDFLTVYLAVAVMITVGINMMQSSHGSILGYATDISVKKLYELTNEERMKAGLTSLTYNDKLAKAAEDKARDMFSHDYWAHYSPEGKTPWDFILGSGYQYEYAGENLAKNFLFSQGVVDAWMASPTHKENIVRKEYKEVGYAVMNGTINGEETTLVVQMFGSPYYDSGSAQAATPQEPAVIPAGDVVQLTDTQRIMMPAPVPQSQPVGSGFMRNYLNLNYIFFILLFISLIFDFYIAAKLNLIHIKGKNLIHMLFIGFILAGTYMIIRGTII